MPHNVGDLIRIIDFETTGLPPDARVVEWATQDMQFNGEAWERGDAASGLVDPRVPIPPEASAIHHIVDSDVLGQPSFDSVVQRELAYDGALGPLLAYCAHRASFEQHFFKPDGVPWIDTYKVAVWLWPDSPNHQNQTLRYWLKLKLATPPGPMHRAAADAYVTAAILRRALAVGASVEDMVDVSSRPAILPKFTFGKWAMRPIDEIDSGYLEWMVKQADMDEDAVYTARHHLQLRRAKEGARR